jgi:signal transduction histidine kinase
VISPRSHFGLGHADPERAAALRRRVLLVGLDVVAIVFAVIAMMRTADADVLLHVVWLVLAIEAFVFGLRATVIRISIATVALVVVAESGGRNHPFESLALLFLSEWPLMVVISLIVAVMADRVATTSRRYAMLYREASDRLITAQENERHRLARDLHDGVSQTLSALAFTLDAADSALWAGSAAPALTRTALSRAQELLGVALEETRYVAFQLRPARIAETGLAGALHELTASSGMPVVTRIDADLVGRRLFDRDGDIELYRIAQEALTNAARYAGAKRVDVTLERQGPHVVMEIIDDGIGFDVKGLRRQRLGLSSMHERAASAGAELTIDSAYGKGTRVRVAIPVADGVLPVPVVPLLADARS